MSNDKRLGLEKLTSTWIVNFQFYVLEGFSITNTILMRKYCFLNLKMENELTMTKG